VVFDKWINPNTRLINVVPNTPLSIQDICVKDLVDCHQGNWNRDLFNLVLPNELNQCILPMMPPYNEARPDRRMWQGEKLERYYVSNAYKRINNFHVMTNKGSWKKIWKLQVP